MFTGQGASLARRRLLRFWSIALSAVLAITLLQVAPPAKATEPLFVDLVTRTDDVVGGQSVLLGETQLRQTSPSVIYRLDIVPECGLLDHIGDIPVDGITDIMGSPISWSAQPENGNFVGTPEKLELVLDNLRIIRKTGDFGYIDCPSSRVLAYLVEEIQWLGNDAPQGTASYVINDSSYPLPTLTTFDSSFNFLTTSRLNTYSNGFEIEWDQFEGSTGYTPAGYSVRYREVFDGQSQRGPWIYQRSDDGRLKSLVVQDPVVQGQAPAFQYEVEVAPTVIDCDSNRLFGKFESVPFVGGFGLSSDPSLLAPNNPQMITGEVVSQCFAACTPVESVAFDGENLATIFKFTNTVPCNWTVPSNLTSTTVDAYVVGGGGGGGAAGGGGGGGGGFETSIGLPIAIDDTWTVRVGTGGVGSDIAAPRGDIGTSSSVTYPGSNGEQTITAPGGGGGGSKDNSGHTSGGDGIYSSVPLSLTFGGAGFGSQGTEGIGGTTVENKYYGAGGNGGNGSTSGTTFIEGVFASGGGGGAVCSSIEALNYPGGTSQNGGSGGYCGGNSQPGSRDGNDASANSGSGGGGGASDADGNDGAGGDGGSGVVYIVHTEAPIARYLPSSCENVAQVCTDWHDTTGTSALTATVTGAPIISETSNPPRNGSALQDSIPVVQGTPSDSIVFPASVMPDNYTLFTVARYNEKDNGSYKRIFDGKSDGSGINWLSGFWGAGTGHSGVAYHGDSSGSSLGVGWLTPVNSIHNFDWVVSTDQNNLYRSNGTTRSYGDFAGGIAPDQLTINGGNLAIEGGEASDFQVADIIVFDRELSESEYQAVEAYLSGEYGICIESCSPPEITTASTLEPGDVGTAYSTTIQVNSASEVSFALSPNSSLPEGLSIDEQTGVISGTPTLDADFTFTIVVTNLSNGQSSSQEFTMTVNAIPPPPSDPPVFETDSLLTNGEFGTAYRQLIEATSPDANPISYEVTDGGLPTGLTLDATSGELTGTPTALGTFTFTVKATNSANNLYDTAEFIINVYASGPVGCKDYRNSSFVPDHFILDETTGYAIGCDPTGQESVTPVVSDNPSSSQVESWSQQFDSEANLEFFRLRNGYKCDDCYVGIDGVDGAQGFPLGFEINYYGETYNSVFVNSNGSISFTAGSDCYDEPLVNIMKCDGNSTSAVVAYGVDLDNSDLDPGKFLAGAEVRHADFFYWGKTLVGGKDAFVATWMNSPGYCSDDIDSGASFYAPDDYDFDVCDDWDVNGTLSTFQIVLVDQSISAETSGDADVIINYGSMQDSQNGYTDCEGPCDSNRDRKLAAGLGKATVIPGDPNTWDYSITSLSAVHGEPPVEILYNGLSAADAADGGIYALSEATQDEGSTAGRFVYEFRNEGSPEVATAPSSPSVSLDTSALSSASILVSPPSDQGGAPVSRYEVRYRIQGTLQWTVATTNLSYAEPTASYSLTRLQSGQSYEVQVAAYNGIGTSSFSEPITFATLDSHESDVDFGGFEWLRVGAGILDVVTDIPSEGEPPAILGSGSMRAYWIPSVDADPLIDGIEITCADTSNSSVTASVGYSTLTCEEMDLSSVQPGLTAQLIRNFAASDPWHQISIKLDNDLAESVTGAIAYRIDLASGSSTEIEMTSDGDLILESADKWFVTTDNSDTNRPASLHYFGTTNGQVYPDGPDSDAGKFWIKKPFTVNSESIQTHRFIDGFTKLAPQETTGEAVIVAMKAADQLEHQQWDGSSNILSSDISDVISEDRDLPSLRIQYECRDFGRNLLYPVLVQNDGQPIGCNFSDEINEGLFPSQAQTNKDDDWKRLFKSTFPNATPRLGWACDTCVITSEGPVEPGLPGSAIADGLPLGFVTSIEGDVVDSIRISPRGYVQLHESGAEDDANAHMVAAFANQELNNEILQGEWGALPDYDFFYWGRTEHQGRLAFVVTWVKIPTLDNGVPLEDPTTMQLMFVSDRTESTLDGYLDNPEAATISNLDVVWNFHSIQGEGSSSGIIDPQESHENLSTYSGIFDSQLSGLSLISDAFMSDNQTGLVGNGSADCDASCVAGNLLANRLQSPVDGRYVLGYRTYEIVLGDPDGPPYIPARGILAPAAPREVEVVRTVGSSATVSWRVPLPWVLRALDEFDEGTTPIYGYRVEYAVNTRGEDSGAAVFPSVDDPPLSSSDESLIVLGPDDTERISITIPELDEKEQYTFRVFAVYSGLDFPDSGDMPIETMEFYSEVRSAPATANEVYESDLEIVTAASQPSQAFAAQGLAEMLSGDLEVSNATINGSPYPYGQTEKSVGIFTVGETSVGFESGIILTPLVDARTFQRGSGITTEDSDSKIPRYFLDPAHRSKYEQIATDFTEFMSQQKSWVPGDGYSPVFDCEDEPDCAFGTTTLQFDVEKPAENDFLKFEYVLAGLESTAFSGYSETAEVYNFPDGFGLFIGGIDQASSCALVPQTDNQTEQERFMSMGNALNSRLASEVGFDSDLKSETVTSVMSCVFDVSDIESDSVTVTMAIANADDPILSTAVFLKSNSIRFEETSINEMEIPAATEGQDYEPLTFTTSGDTPPDSWLAEGLPEGMELTSSGDLIGRPTESGNFNFTVIAKDLNNVVLATQAFSILVNAFEAESDINDRFLQGQYVEVGIAGNGRFGSSGAAPSGYNPRDPGRGPESGPSQRRIGFVSDRDKDGWGVGQDDGDFFIPGDPFEGFGVDIGGNSYFNNDEDTDIARLSEVTDTNSDRQQSTWTSEEMPNGLQVTQVAAVPVNDQRLDVTVTLTNNSGEALEDVYYARQVDNDANVYACQENEGGWRSLNKVVAQANSDDRVSLVSSIMMDDCNDSTAPTDTSAPHSYLGMISTHPDSVAALQGFNDFGAQQAIDFVNGVSEEECQSRGDSEISFSLCLPVMIVRGSQVFGDAGIGLGFDLGTIEAGGSKTITFSYILSANQAQDIIDQHNIDNDIVAPAITTVGEPALRALIGRSFESATSTWVENTGGSISYYTISPELPDGLSLNSETGDISGTPTATMETTSFTLTASNLAGSSSVSFALEIEESIDCRSNPEADLKVVLLRKISANPSTENNSTVNEIDTNIAQTLCRSSHIDLTLFRGGDGSPEAWDAALTGKDVLVLPATTFDLVGSNLMSSEALTWITIWMRQGGRVVVTDSSQHAIELERLLGLTQDPLDFMTSNDSHVDNNQAPTAMPERLVLSDSDNSSNLLLLPTGSHTNEMLDIGLDSINIYGTSIDLGQELVSASAATQFGVDRGHVIQISANYSGDEPSISWNKLLLASVYGTPTRYLGINEPDATWVLSGSELYWDEMNPAAIISLGNGLSRDAVRCVNVPSSPSIRKVTALGTEVKCGSYRLFDGITDSGVQIQLKRFFSANAAWLGSKVEISNLDTENTYRNSIYYGGSQGQNSTMQIEATNDVTHNLSNLNSYMQEPHWYITSRGESISRDADGPEGKIVTTVLGPDNFASYGGSDRYSLPLLGNDEILSEKTMEIDGLESRSFTFFTGLTEYEPGCDRLAVSTSKTAAAALNSQFDPDLRWPDFDEISFPELSTSECESYFDQVSGMSISQRNEVVSVSWPRLPNADMYELQFQLLGQDSWSSSLYQSSSEDIESIWNFTNLNEGAVYNFRIRPIEINRNSSSDNANGRWLLTDPGFTVETWSSPTPSPSSSSGSPSPSPSSSPSPSQPPVVNNAGPDLSATIVPQMIAQTAPGLPARLKRGKTVRFGMTAPSGLPLRVTSVGQCKTTAITKRVTIRVVEGKKVKKKRVKMQTGWAVKATRKKGLCTVTFSNSGDATRSPLASAGTITVF